MVHKNLTKIIITLGPATDTKEKIKSLIEKAGVSVFRLNCSHGTKEQHEESVKKIREVEKELNTHVSILFDLQGPKLRIGEFETDKEIILKKGDSFRLDMDASKPGNSERVCLPHPEIFQVMHVGMLLILNDGKVKLKVTKFGRDFAETEVLVGGSVSNHKGVNIPGIELPISALTEKDLIDLKMAISLGANWIGLSFVQRPEDVYMAKSLIQGRAGIIAKIEKPTAIKSLDKIIKLADGVMVARGDLGVETSAAEVPVLQKRIVKEARRQGKPVIVATQMLETMITSPIPTRAEASDIATAVYDGVDAVMLSGETSVGNFPIEAATVMSEIINNVEQDPMYFHSVDAFPDEHCDDDVGTAITSASKQAALILPDIKAIVSYTMTGSTTFKTAKERPHVPIISITPIEKVAQKVSLLWGVTPVVSENYQSIDETETEALTICRKMQFIKEVGDKVIITAGYPFANNKANTNLLYIASAKED